MIQPNPLGQVSIASFALETYGWGIENDITPLWFPGRYVMGEPIHIPGLNGDITYPVDLGSFEFIIKLGVIGDLNSAGVPYADSVVGLESNINTIRTNLDPVLTGSGTRTATLTMPSGATRTATVLVKELSVEITHINMAAGECGNSVDATAYTRLSVPILVTSGVFA